MEMKNYMNATQASKRSVYSVAQMAGQLAPQRAALWDGILFPWNGRGRLSGTLASTVSGGTSDFTRWN